MTKRNETSSNSQHAPSGHPAGNEALRVIAVILALDEASSIAQVVEALRGQGDVALHNVVDNGSSDGTGEVDQQAGASVVREERPGYAYTCLAGVRAAKDADVIVLLDGADDPYDLPCVLDPLLSDEADLVVGSRTLRKPGSMTQRQLWGNRCLLDPPPLPGEGQRSGVVPGDPTEQPARASDAGDDLRVAGGDDGEVQPGRGTLHHNQDTARTGTGTGDASHRAESR